jgi:anti-anti-sigma factor
MKRHQLASAVSADTRNERSAVSSAADRTQTAFDDNTDAERAASEPRFVLASVTVRTHTLVLTGELDRRSALVLEAEIESLCEEGVTGITLDLRELTSIDSIGVAVIAFRCGLCQRRGYDFALIPGSRLVQSAFEQAGVAELLPFQQQDVETPRLPALVLGHRSRDACEQ